MTLPPPKASRATSASLPMSIGAVVAAALTISACSGGSPAERVSGGPTGQLCRSRGHPQDQARDRDHAGEPILRLLLRNLPGCGGHPHGERESRRCAWTIRPPGTCVAPYVDHADVNGGGPHSAPNATADINGGKMDGFIGQAESGQKRLSGSHRSGVHELDRTRRDGLPHRKRHPELLDLRQGLRPPGPHVRAERLVEPAGTPVPGLRMVGLLHPAGQSVELRQRPSDSARRATGRTPRPSTEAKPVRRTAAAIRSARNRNTMAGQPIYAWTDLTYLLYKSHVSWGYYVVSGTEPDCENPAAETCAAVGQNAEHSGDLEPAAVVRHRAGRSPARQHPGRRPASTPRRRLGPCPRCRGSCRRAR